MSQLKYLFDILIGSIPLTGESSDNLNEKAFSSTVFFAKSGAIEIVYSKMHLFDVEIEGQPVYRESDRFLAGDGPRTFFYKGWNMGLSICYDLRFSELFSFYANKCVDIIFVPASFLVPTGAAHWHSLLRARAIESQAYVLAPAQSGKHQRDHYSHATFGHSLVIDPWGEICHDLGQESPKISKVSLKASRLAWVRKQIPMENHRKKIVIGSETNTEYIK